METNRTAEILNNKGQLFRITYQQVDYYFRVIKPTKISASTSEIAVLMDDETYIIERDGRLWVFKDAALDNDFANAIGRLICLRYRL